MNFKKCTSFLMAVYLLVSTSGLIFHVHYCGGEIASVSTIFKSEESCGVEKQSDEESCCVSSTEDHSVCCSDEVIQADFDEVTIKQISFDFDYVSILSAFKAPVFYANTIVTTSQKLDYYCDSNAPPFYQLYSQFVFYA